MTEIKAFISCETFNNVGRLNGNVLNSFQNSVDTDIKGCCRYSFKVDLK